MQVLPLDYTFRKVTDEIVYKENEFWSGHFSKLYFVFWQIATFLPSTSWNGQGHWFSNITDYSKHVKIKRWECNKKYISYNKTYTA